MTNPSSTTGTVSGRTASHAPLSIDSDERRRMIAEAAYYRAAARNFADGYEEEDWLEAEAEVDRLLRPSDLDTFED